MQAEDCKMNCCTIWFQIDHFQRVFLSHETLREWKQGKGRGNDLFWGGYVSPLWLAGSLPE